jgi:broad specificity phosphatase PhoE
MALTVTRRTLLYAATAALVPAMERADPPKQILIIRHAEKTGLKDDIHLNTRGYERAEALARLFPVKFDIPKFLFATRQTVKSDRPVETLTPLAKALGLKIDARFDVDEYAALANAVLSGAPYSGKTVLVCWHHGRIPALAAALGVKDPPSPWPDRQFDRVWQIRYVDGAAAFADLPQRLLAGDS